MPNLKTLSVPDVVARRRGRIAFGAVLSMSVILVPLSAVLPTMHGFTTLLGVSKHSHASHVIFGLWVLAAAAYLTVRFVPAVALRRSRKPGLQSSAGAMASFNVAATQLSPRATVASFVLPTFGIALLAPLSLHAFMAGVAAWSFHGFDDWIRISLLLVGLAHLVFAGSLAWHVKLLAARTSRFRRWRATVTSVMAATLAGFLPGAMFILPPILVCVTGFVLAPIILGVMERAAIVEARALHAARSRQGFGSTIETHQT